MIRSLLIFLSLIILAGQVHAQALANKKFKRALIIGGGGIAPGVGLGIIAGVEKAGWVPDVIITTCGASLAAAVKSSYPDSSQGLEYMKSQSFHNLFMQVQLATPNLLNLRKKFEAAKNSSQIVDFFQGNILQMDGQISGIFANPNFRSESGVTKFVMLSAKANFGPQNVGQPKTADLFTQVYFTDTDTAAALQNIRSPIAEIFPQSLVAAKTMVLSDKTIEQAARGSISDPFLINPGQIDNDYYFTGAVDLFPIELAKQIAEEVVVTFPGGLFTDYENVAIESSFGFNQTQRVLHSIQHTDVKWIDISGIDDLKFDPTPVFLKLQNNIPKKLPAFAKGIQSQFDFGFARAQEAIQLQQDGVNVRTHLRKPINPQLLQSFTCANAYEWKVPGNSSCTDDSTPGCDRQEVSQCTPIR